MRIKGWMITKASGFRMFVEGEFCAVGDEGELVVSERDGRVTFIMALGEWCCVEADSGLSDEQKLPMFEKAFSR